mgnify:CR=1 FL=1
MDLNNTPRSNVDTITYSFLFETQDQKGQPKYEAQQIVLQGDEIIRADRDQALSGKFNIEIGDSELGAGEKLKAELPNLTQKKYLGQTLFHVNNLPFKHNKIPEVFTEFRKKVEKLEDDRLLKDDINNMIQLVKTQQIIVK